MSYDTLKYSVGQKIIANCDKMSVANDSKVCHSPYGTIRMYKSNERGRFYSVSKSTVPHILHNGGSYKIGTLRSRLMTLDKFKFS